MAKTLYDLLSINDASSRQMRLLSREKTADSYTIDVDQGHAQLIGEMSQLVRQGVRFRNCIFTTHGNKGVISFGNNTDLSRGMVQGNFMPVDLIGFSHSRTPKCISLDAMLLKAPDGWQFLGGSGPFLIA